MTKIALNRANIPAAVALNAAAMVLLERDRLEQRQQLRDRHWRF